MNLETAERVLLVEFTNADQFPGQVCRTFPFISGYLKRFDIPSRWLRFALPTSHLLDHDRDEVTLDDDEFERLLNVTSALRPDLVVSTHSLAAEQIEAMNHVVPRAAYVLRDSELFHDATNSQRSERGFLGIAELDRPGFVPHYEWEAGNDAALRADRHNIYLLTARRCGYFKSVRQNPFYELVELPAGMDGGCAFCCGRLTPDNALGRSHWVAEGPTPESWIARQIQGIDESLGPDRYPNALLLEDVEHPDIVRTLFQALEKSRMVDHVNVLVGLRVDRLLALESWLKDEIVSRSDTEGLLPFQVFSCGLESFSDDELRRLNKGTTALMNLRAINLLWELEFGQPGRFYFSGYRGLSMILFTPWTTLADLHLNVRLIQHLGLEEVIGNAFISRLRLHPDLAVTFLARDDGVIIDEEPDEVLRSNRRKLFSEELSWRHLDERVGTVSRVVTRLDNDPSLVDDDLYRRINQTFIDDHSHDSDLDGPRRRWYMFEVFLHLVETALGNPPGLTDEELIDGAHQRLVLRRAAVESRRDRRHQRRLGDHCFDIYTYLKQLIAFVKNGSKPAVSIENIWDGELLTSELGRIDFAGLHHSLVQVNGSGRKTLVIAREKIELLALLKLEKQIANATSQKERADACVRAGLLYGYPRCCARSWSSSPRPHVAQIPWSLMDLRSREPGRITGTINPLLAGELAFIPCSPSCVEADRVLSTWIPRLGIDLELHKSASTATLFHLNALDGEELVTVRILSSSDVAIRYDPNSIDHQRDELEEGELRRQLMTCDELRLAPGQIQLYRRGTMCQIWTASVGLWHGPRSWHGEFWSELSAAASRRADPDSSKAAATVASFARGFVADNDGIP